jgi:hypothetical protein
MVPARVSIPTLFAISCLMPTPLPAQRGDEAYQTVSLGVGWGAVRPGGATGLPGGPADGGTSLHFSAAMEVRQNEWALVYGRLDADGAEIRQHLGATVGGRIMPPLTAAIRPYAGAGAGLLMLEPRAHVSDLFRREYKLRSEAFAGAEWAPVPVLSTFVEYRLTAARYLAMAQRQGCTPVEACLQYSRRDVLHLGHSGWIGLRIRLI